MKQKSTGCLAIVTGEIEAAQAAYDALSAEEQERQSRPVVYNLP